MNTIDVPYRPSWRFLLIAGGLFALCSATLVRVATTSGSVKVHLTLSLLSALLVVAALMATVARYNPGQRLIIDDREVVLPRSRWSSTRVRLPITSIKAISVGHTDGQPSVELHTDDGSEVIVADMLPSREAFDRVVTVLLERTEQR